jgi:hypothetical protein
VSVTVLLFSTDFILESEVLTIPPASSEECVQVTANLDDIIEDIEMFKLSLQSNSSIEERASEQTISIQDRDSKTLKC